MKYKAFIFDVSDTLIEYKPNYAQIYGDRLRGLGYEITDEKAKDISRVVNWVIGEEARKEQYGEPHLSEDKLSVLLDEAAISCVTNNNVNKQHLDTLSKIPTPKQEMLIIPGVIDVLTVLKRKYRLAIVSNGLWII